MALTYVDTRQIEDITNDISSLISEYNVIINKLFSRLGNVPYETKEWVGGKAELYFKTVMLEKSDFLYFGDRLTAFNNYIKKVVNETELTIKQVNSKEQNGDFDD